MSGLPEPVKPTQATDDDSSIASDHSFVILGQGSLPLESDGGGAHSMNPQQFSLTNGEHQQNGSVIGDLEGNENSALPDASSIEIQQKLEKLVKENLLLKETLNQSNLAMKNQFDTLTLWHEEVVKTHESHKQKFQETQEQIFKLRNENLGLKKLIQQNLEKCYGSNSALVNLEHEGINSSLDKGAENNSNEVNFHFLCVEELRMKNTELERQLHDIAQEKLDLEKKLEKALEENFNLKKEAESKTDICIQCQGPKSLICIGGCNENQEKEKCSQEMSLDPEMSIINKLTRSVEAELVISASKQELAELKKKFEEQSEISLKNSEKLEKIMAMYDEILAENDKLKNVLEESNMKNEELTRNIVSLHEELKIRDEQLQAKINEVEQVKKEMQKLVLDYEEVAILRAQVELYQSDFIEERKAREQAVTEKERIAEQVRFLERTLSDIKKKDAEYEKKASTSSPTEEKTQFSYVCPKCMKRLPTLTECETHVDACLDMDMFP